MAFFLVTISAVVLSIVKPPFSLLYCPSFFNVYYGYIFAQCEAPRLCVYAVYAMLARQLVTIKYFCLMYSAEWDTVK